MEGKVYPEVLSTRGIVSVIPEPVQRERLNSLIFDELVKGVFNDSTKNTFEKRRKVCLARVVMQLLWVVRRYLLFFDRKIRKYPCWIPPGSSRELR